MKIEVKKSTKAIVGILLIIIISFLIEIFVFNYNSFNSSITMKGDKKLEVEDLILNDIGFDGEKLIITGENPFFEIKDNIIGKILKVKVVPSEYSMPFEVSVFNKGSNKMIGKIHQINPLFKGSAWIKVNENDSQLKFVISSENEKISISELRIDNDLRINYNRLLILITVFTLLLMFYLNFNYFSKNLHISFLIIAIFMGINIVFLLPTYFSYDEREHFVKAYQISSLDIGIENGKIINWPDNIEKFLTPGESNYENYDEKIEYFKEYSSNKIEKTGYYKTTASTYLMTAYIPAAIGIAVARLLQLPFIGIFYFGRIFALLAYVGIIFYVIKHIKIAKRFIFIIGLLPGLLYLSSAYSADPMTLAFSLAMISIFINMIAAEDFTVTGKNVFSFILCCGIMITCKPTYAPLALIIFGVPYKKFLIHTKIRIKPETYAFFIKLMVMCIIGAIFILNLLYSNSKGLEQWTIPGVDVKQQVVYILANPLRYIVVCIKNVSENALMYFQSAISNFAYSGSFPTIIDLIVISCIVILAVIDNENKILSLNYKIKIILFLAIIITWGLTITPLYLTFTEVGSNTIKGVQGRYFAPLLLPVLLLLKNNKIIDNFTKNNLNKIIILFSTLLLVLLLVKLLIGFSM